MAKSHIIFVCILASVHTYALIASNQMENVRHVRHTLRGKVDTYTCMCKSYFYYV